MCQCSLLPAKCATCVEMELRGMFGVGVGPKRLVACGEGQSIHSIFETDEERSSHLCAKGYHP